MTGQTITLKEAVLRRVGVEKSAGAIGFLAARRVTEDDEQRRLGTLLERLQREILTADRESKQTR